MVFYREKEQLIIYMEIQLLTGKFIVSFTSEEKWLTLSAINVEVIIRESLQRHVTRNHTDHLVISCNQCERSFGRCNLEKHKRNCTVGQVAVPVAAPAAKKRRIGVAPEFKFTVTMKEARHLSTLKEAIAVFTHVRKTFHQGHRAYKFQIAVCVVFHKAVDPAVVTQPPVTLTSEMVAVYSDAVPPFEDVNRQLLNFIEVYEHNGSGWVFSNFAPLQLTL